MKVKTWEERSEVCDPKPYTIEILDIVYQAMLDEIKELRVALRSALAAPQPTDKNSS